MNIDIDTLEFEAESGRLFGTTTFLGCSFHIEAIPVCTKAGRQVGATPIADSRLNGLAEEFGVVAFTTITIKRRTYVLCITPFGA